MVLSIWEQHTQSNGKTYWFNPKTNTSTYEKPQIPAGEEFKVIIAKGAKECEQKPSGQEVAARLGPGWFAEVDLKSGKAYVYNPQTKDRKWWFETAPTPSHGPSSAPSAPVGGRSSPAPAGGQSKGRSGGWDAEDFLLRLRKAEATGVKDNEKIVLKEVAEDNYSMVTGDPNSWKVPRTNLITTAECNRSVNTSGSRDPRISLSHRTTGEALLQMHASNPKQKVCALNFANGVKVGGGYKNGATAQEEDLCRQIPTLYSSLFNAQKWGKAYPFGPATYKGSSPARYCDVLFTSDLLVARDVKDNGYAMLSKEQMPLVSLVSAAAPNIRFGGEVHQKELVQKCVDNIFMAPILQNRDLSVLVLGAWGCGAFGGDPYVMADHFVTSLKKGLGKLYGEIHFAIPIFNADDKNAEIFEKVLRESGVDLVIEKK